MIPFRNYEGTLVGIPVDTSKLLYIEMYSLPAAKQ